MSGQYNFYGGLQEPRPTRSTTTNSTACYTAVDDSAVVTAVLFANETAGPVQADLYFDDGSTEYLISAQQIPGYEAGIFENAPIKLRSGSSVNVTVDTANAITVTPIVVIQSPSEAAPRPAFNNMAYKSQFG